MRKGPAGRAAGGPLLHHRAFAKQASTVTADRKRSLMIKTFSYVRLATFALIAAGFIAAIVAAQSTPDRRAHSIDCPLTQTHQRLIDPVHTFARDVCLAARFMAAVDHDDRAG